MNPRPFQRRPPARTFPTALTLSACGLLLAAGCDLVTGTTRPEKARVIVEGDFDDSVRIVTSNNFFFGIEEGGIEQGIQFIDADTFVVSLPFDRTFDLPPTYWFVVRAYSPDSGRVTMRLRVDLDGTTQYDRMQEMEDAFLQYYVTHN